MIRMSNLLGALICFAFFITALVLMEKAGAGNDHGRDDTSSS
jgi:hypothetical protein